MLIVMYILLTNLCCLMFSAGGNASSRTYQTPILSPKDPTKISTWMNNSWNWENLGACQSRIREQYLSQLLRSL